MKISKTFLKNLINNLESEYKRHYSTNGKQKKVHQKRTKCMFLIKKNTDAERMKRDDALE